MAIQFDHRVVRLGIEIDGQIAWYDDLYIRAQGEKFAGIQQGRCTVTVLNLNQEHRNYILSRANPFNRFTQRNRIIIEAGRVSDGVARLFVGDAIKSSESQPPDVALTIEALSGNYEKSIYVGTSFTENTPLSQIAQSVASDLGVSLNFQAADKAIKSYSYSGTAYKQIEKLKEAGDINAFLDEGVLIVKDSGIPITGSRRVLNIDTGLIGKPEVTERGIKVRYLFDNQTRLGGELVLQSMTNPSLNGSYTIFKLQFDIANREIPFYWIAEASRND